MKRVGVALALAFVLAPVGSARVSDLGPGVGGIVITWSGPTHFRQQNLILVFSQTGREVARTRTDTRGIFAVSLAPGNYDVDADVPNRERFLKTEMKPGRVRVLPRFRSTVRLVWDIGIR